MNPSHLKDYSHITRWLNSSHQTQSILFRHMPSTRWLTTMLTKTLCCTALMLPIELTVGTNKDTIVYNCTYCSLGKIWRKNFSSLVWHDENWTHEILLTMVNKKVIFFIHWRDSKGRKYFTMNKFHIKISNGEFFPNYGTSYFNIYYKF